MYSCLALIVHSRVIMCHALNLGGTCYSYISFWAPLGGDCYRILSKDSFWWQLTYPSSSYELTILPGEWVQVLTVVWVNVILIFFSHDHGSLFGDCRNCLFFRILLSLHHRFACKTFAKWFSILERSLQAMYPSHLRRRSWSLLLILSCLENHLLADCW